MVKDIYTSLKPLLEDLMGAMHEITNNKEKLKTTGPIFSLLHNLKFEDFLIYRLNVLGKSYFLTAINEHSMQRIEHLWAKIMEHKDEILTSANLTEHQKNIINQEINFAKISDRLEYITIIKFLADDNLLKETFFKRYPTLKDKINNFFVLNKKEKKSITFSNTTNLVRILRKQNLVSEKDIYNYNLTEDEWKGFLCPAFDNPASILFDFFDLNEIFENDYMKFHKTKKTELIEQLKSHPEQKNYIRHHINVLGAYKNIKESFDIIKDLSPLQIFFLRIFYDFNIKHFFGNKTKYILPLYLFHFSKNYEQAKRFISLFEESFNIPVYIKYISLSVLSAIILAFGNIVSYIGLAIYISHNKIGKWIKENFKFQIDIRVPIKLIAIATTLLSLPISPVFQKLFITNPIQTIFFDTSTKQSSDKVSISNDKQKIEITINMTGFDIESFKTQLAQNTQIIDQIKQNIQSQIEEKSFHGSAEKQGGKYNLKSYETLYDVVNKQIDNKIGGSQKENLIYQVTKQYISTNRTYFRKQASNMLKNAWMLKDLELAKYLPTGTEIDLDEINGLIKNFSK